MTALLVVLAFAVAGGIIVALALVARAAAHGLRRHPPARLAYRWMTGLPWDGRDPVPDVDLVPPWQRGSERERQADPGVLLPVPPGADRDPAGRDRRDRACPWRC